jgi:hypothetical protein
VRQPIWQFVIFDILVRAFMIASFWNAQRGAVKSIGRLVSAQPIIIFGEELSGEDSTGKKELLRYGGRPEENPSLVMRHPPRQRSSRFYFCTSYGVPAKFVTRR